MGPSPTSTCGPPTVTKTRQTASITQKPSVEPRRPRLRDTLRTCEEQTLHPGGGRLVDGDTASSVLAASLGILDGLDAAGVTAVYLAANSTMASVSRWFRHTSRLRDTNRPVEKDDQAGILGSLGPRHPT